MYLDLNVNDDIRMKIIIKIIFFKKQFGWF